MDVYSWEHNGTKRVIFQLAATFEYWKAITLTLYSNIWTFLSIYIYIYTLGGGGSPRGGRGGVGWGGV